MGSKDTQKKDVVFEVAEHVVRIRYEDLPPEDIDATKRCILDTLGCTLAGSAQPPLKQLVAYFKDQGGKPEATIIAYGGKVPVRNAVIINGSMARALDLDDVYEEKVPTHASVVAVPVAFAMAERKGGVSGQELIAAVALGQDVMIRLARACKIVPMSCGRSVSGSFGSFAAAATAAKILELDVSKVVDAMGNAYCQTAAEMQCFLDGALSQRVHQGLSTSAGVFAAILAEIGVSGSRNVLEGKHGYYSLWEGSEYTRGEITTGLGRKFWGTNISVKPFPCCKAMHAAVEGALRLVVEDDIKPEDVDNIVIRCPAEIEEEWDSVGLFRPEKADPKGEVEAKFSTLWGVGTVIVKRKAWIEDFTMEGVRSSRDAVVPVARKVRAIFDPKLPRSPDSLGPAIVEIQTKDGKVHTKRIDHVKGSPQNPFTWEEMTARFRDCASYSIKPLPDERVKRVVEMVRNLDQVEDICEIVNLLG